MVTEFAVLGVPSAAGTHRPGHEDAPEHIRAAGLTGRLKAGGPG